MITSFKINECQHQIIKKLIWYNNNNNDRIQTLKRTKMRYKGKNDLARQRLSLSHIQYLFLLNYYYYYYSH